MALKPANIAAGYDIAIQTGADLAPLWFPYASGVMEEAPESPSIELADQGTFIHTYYGDWETCKFFALPRGAYLEDQFANLFRVLSSHLEHGRGNKTKLVLTSESVSFAVPPDEFEIEPIEFNPALQKNPRYYVNPPDGNHLSETDIANLQIAIDAPQSQARNEAKSLSAQSDNPALFLELYSKLARGEDTYYLSGQKVTWTGYFAAPQPVFSGGVIQNPWEILPSQFAYGITGLIFPDGWSWLRQADHQVFNRTWWRLTISWIGGPSGHWDKDIYPSI